MHWVGGCWSQANCPKQIYEWLTKMIFLLLSNRFDRYNIQTSWDFAKKSRNKLSQAGWVGRLEKVEIMPSQRAGAWQHDLKEVF